MSSAGKRRGSGVALILAGAMAVVCGHTTFGAERRQPNVILILIDDMGWRDVGFMGNGFVETPALDALARDGLVFTQAYASAPNCAPTRACLMSGQVTPRHGVYTVVDPRQPPGSPWHKLLAAESNSDLATEVVTIPEALRGAGYATAFFGMWNLGRGRRGPTTPGGQGFETVVFPENLGFGKDAYHDDAGNYLSDRLTDELLEFVERERDRPFFAYFADHAVHAPYDPPTDLVGKYERKGERDRRDHAADAATIEGVDRNVARIVAALDRLGLREETIVVFTSDNGGTPQVTPPLRGSKGQLYEGGIRVPMVVSWPGRVSPASSDIPVATVDLYPTLLDLGRAAAPPAQPLDGTSLAGFLSGKEAPERERLFWHFPCYVGKATPSSAVREGDWKLVEFFEDGGHVELFNLRDDPHEQNDLAAAEPKRADALTKTLRAWQAATGAAIPKAVNPAYDPAAVRPRGGPGAGGGGGGPQGSRQGEKGGKRDGEGRQPGGRGRREGA
ncbi:MAG: sulfatase [Planctomycetota bacterium]|nr:sulfatase [Planctomycetota bacterium]